MCLSTSLSKLTNKIILFYTTKHRSPIIIGCCTFLILITILYFLPGKQKLYINEDTHYHQIVSFYMY